MLSKSGFSSEDEFPEVDVLIQRIQDKNELKRLKETSKPRIERIAKDGPANLNTTGKPTPLRRRKLGQGQTMDGSLLKPWNDTVPSKEKEGRTSKFRESRPRAGVSTEADDPSDDESEPLAMKARQTKARKASSRVVASKIHPDNLSEAKGKEPLKQTRTEKNDFVKGGKVSEKSTSRLTPSTQLVKDYDALKDLLEFSEEEEEEEEEDESEFLSMSDSETDTWKSDAEPTLTPPGRRPKGSTSQWANPQRTLFKDPSKKIAVPAGRKPMEAITGPKKQASRKQARGDSVLRSLKASQSGSLEDTFQKLQIFDEDSESDESLVKGPKKHTLEPTTPKKTLPASPFKAPPIPPSPWKPEQKEFWDSNAHFDWIDQHSPEKKPDDGSKNKAKRDDAKTKMNRQHSINLEKRNAKKTFDAIKEELARSFLAELDQRVTDGQLGQLTQNTGGLQITWSKTLNSTAGRAHWKCKTVSVSTPAADGSFQKRDTQQHYASIELATKVLGNESSLLNTVAHEFCHLAVFLLHGRVKAAHGSEFKYFGALCGRAFADRGIEVTTKHNYEIDYKFIWQCVACGSEVKRHSKSLDTEAKRCGKCRGQFIQTKPAVRGAGGASNGMASLAGGTINGKETAVTTAAAAATAAMTPGKKKPSAYQEFTAKEIKTLKQTNPSMSFKEMMAIVSVRWKQQKEQNGLLEQKRGQTVKELRTAVEVLTIEDDDDDDGRGGGSDMGKRGMVKATVQSTYDIFG